jgi:hypothetical protein
LAAYPLLVVPEQTRLGSDLVEALESHARAGGCVVLSGAHLAHECPAFVGARAAGAAIEETIYLVAGEGAVGVPGPWQAVRPLEGVEAWAHRLAQQEPGRDATGDVVVTRRRLGEGSIVGIHGPVFRRYQQGHYPQLREFIAQLVARLEIAWLVTVDGPAWLELVVRRKAGRLLVNLINRGAGETLHARRAIVEELPPVRDAGLTIRWESAPRSVSLVPEGCEATWRYDEGVVRVQVPQVEVHSVVVVS